MFTHDDIGYTIDRLEQLRGTARDNDAVEAWMAIKLAAAASLPSAAWVAGYIRDDAQRAWERSGAAMNRIRSCHRWLEQSRDSIVELERGRQAWAEATSRVEQSRDGIQEVLNQPRQWEGAGAAEERATALKQLKDQERLRQASQAIAQDCERARTVMTGVFAEVAVLVHTTANSIFGSAVRAPSLANLFSLNARVKAVASGLERAAAEYEGVRAGQGWRPAANELGRNLDQSASGLRNG